jgi:SNF2 family DNA or RNA helicase
MRATKRHNKLLDERFAQPADVYIINPENLRSDQKEKRVVALCKRLKKEGYEIILAIDESSKLKSRTSRTYVSLKKIRAYCDRCIIMTGTPSPNGIQDLWAQFSVLDGGKTLQPNFIDYRFDTCQEIALRGVTWQDKSGGKHAVTKWQPKPGMAMQVHRILEPRTIRFKTEDCIDLPPRRFIIRYVEMSAEQAAVYAAMEEMLFVEFEGEPVTARVAAAKLMKLRETTGGFIITDAGVAKPIGKDPPKMEELDLLLEQSIADKLGDSGMPNKGIVWAQYQWECKAMVQRYKQYGARGLFGGISDRAKDEAIARFKSDPNSRLLVCHPASVGHGLTLVSANFVFYYSLSHNFEEFYQSYRRNSRAGQNRAMTYYFLICPDTIDEEMLDANRSKKNLSDLVTDGRLSREDILGQREERRAARGGQIDLDLSFAEDPAGPDQ